MLRQSFVYFCFRMMLFVVSLVAVLIHVEASDLTTTSRMSSLHTVLLFKALDYDIIIARQSAQTPKLGELVAFTNSHRFS